MFCERERRGRRVDDYCAFLHSLPGRTLSRHSMEVAPVECRRSTSMHTKCDGEPSRRSRWDCVRGRLTLRSRGTET
jgi:hypothetical protein